MPPVDFRLAPPPTMVDGLLAVPIDVQSVQASVVLDGAASTAQADVTMTYEVGPTAGNPIFDLRQTIGQAWLDGAPLAVGLLAAHDVGAGSFSTIRVLESVQPAGSVHQLRLTYPLATPQSQLGGSYPPALQWSAGPRLRWSFGFSDLNAGRYLEAWFPSNLIFDQFTVDLDIQLVGTLAAHTLITNGAVTVLGGAHWRVQFPDRFAPPAHLLELRASNSIEGQTDAVLLPVSGTTVTVEAWKLAGGADNLTTRINDAKTFLIDNETDYGAFLGDRFVIFFHGAGGGMEYAGATTTSAGALDHETFHSWFARGISPASQADGWWDEGFATFHDSGADDAEPFDFLDPPVTLCSRQPFQRRTPSNAYSDGSRFFRGVAAQLGIAPFNSAMRALYEANRGNPVSTAMVEEHLLTRSGVTNLVDAFHRFVYGFSDSAPAPRLWLRDDPGHGGADLWGGAFWDSPDLWVRHADDGGTVHQPPEYGQDNWFYARVRNDVAGGDCRHFVVTFQVKEFAGTQFVYPGDFLPCVAARAEFDLAAGETRVVSARWPRDRVPLPGTHPCLLASVQARGDHPAAGAHVWEHANLAQKNLTVVDLIPGEFVILPIVLLNLGDLPRALVEIWRDPRWPEVEIGVVHRSKAFFAGRSRLRPLDVPAVRLEPRHHELMDCGGLEPDGRGRFGGILTSGDPVTIARRFLEGVELRIGDERRSRVPIAL
ncbi:MAG: hypothetical protein IT336_02130, partial [Thermomicrobiales bacterium]|nr:hypothetical protein [Thermomicrobiales bacterium]